VRRGIFSCSCLPAASRLQLKDHRRRGNTQFDALSITPTFTRFRGASGVVIDVESNWNPYAVSPKALWG